jgi:hypothetical protein
MRNCRQRDEEPLYPNQAKKRLEWGTQLFSRHAGAGGMTKGRAMTFIGNREIGWTQNCRSLHCATPDFLSRLVALTNFMRLSLRKAAHVDVGEGA